MSKVLALIHTVGELVPTFKALCAEVIPDIVCFHVCDEGLIRTLSPEKQLTPRTARRLAELVSRAEDDGADLILVTCSSISPTVDLAQPMVRVPVLKIDEAMADLAIQKGERIGILATARSALVPVSNLVRSRAEAQGRKVEVISLLLDGAIEKLQAGDTASHDRAVVEGIKELGTECDLIVLAQGSMARAIEGLPEGTLRCPVLTNARLGLLRAAEQLEQTGR